MAIFLKKRLGARKTSLNDVRNSDEGLMSPIGNNLMKTDASPVRTANTIQKMYDMQDRATAIKKYPNHTELSSIRSKA